MKFISGLILAALMCIETSGQDSSHIKYQPGDHELLMMPTAYTLEQGGGYFTDYELLFLNLTYAPGPSTHVGLFFLFPVVTSFLETITLGAKQNYVRTEYFQSALWGTFTPKNRLYTIGNVVSAGPKRASFHLGLAFAGAEGESILLILAGTRYDFSQKVSGIFEYSNAKELLDAEFGGFIIFGIRFRGETNSWEIGGARVLENTSSDFLFAPYLKATFFF